MSEWREVNIGDIANLYQGLAINKKTNYLLVEKSTLPLLRIKDLQDNTQEFFVNDKEAPVKCIVNEDDLIFTRTGIVGMVFMGKKGVLHNNCFRIVPKNTEMYLQFYYHYFNRESMRDYLTNISAGSVQPDMNHTIFKTVKVPFPPLKEQQAIAEILSSLDDKIDLLHRQNKTLEALAQTLFRQWFVEEAGDEWKEYKLSDVLEIKYGKDHKKLADGNIPVYGSGGIMRYADSFLYDKESILIPRKGTLTNLFYIDEPFWTVDTIFWSKINTEKVSGKFLFSFLKTMDLSNLNVGSAVPSLTTKVLNEIKISLPSLDEQKEFNEYTDSAWIKIKSNLQQIKTLENMRDTLLPKLMSGEVRVKF